MKKGRASGLGRSAAAVAALLFVVGGCGPAVFTQAAGSPTPSPIIALPTELPDAVSYEQSLPLFEYDRSVPFDVVETMAYPRKSATFHDLSYVGANGVRMPAYLVVPWGKVPHAGITWMGWTGGYTQIREEFVAEAEDMADEGVVSLLVSGYFPWYAAPADKDADRMAMIGQVRELRRAVDFLLSQANVDADRIGFVGHSMGAMHGIDLVAVDHRVKAAVLLAPHATMTDWIFDGYGLDPATEDEYRKVMASFDPLAFVPHAAPSALFFQFASDDPYVPEAAADSLFNAASNPKKIGRYSGAHDLDEQARTERDAWLTQELELTN